MEAGVRQAVGEKLEIRKELAGYRRTQPGLSEVRTDLR